MPFLASRLACPNGPAEHEQAAGGDPVSGTTYCDAGPFPPQAYNECCGERDEDEHGKNKTKQGDSGGLEEAHAGSVQVSMVEAEEKRQARWSRAKRASRRRQAIPEQ